MKRFEDYGISMTIQLYRLTRRYKHDAQYMPIQVVWDMINIKISKHGATVVRVVIVS